MEQKPSLVLIAASAISSGEVILDNVLKIVDVKTQLEIVRVLGVRLLGRENTCV